MSISTSAAFALVVFVVASAGLAMIPTMLPNDVYAMQTIKVKDGPGAVLCNAAGFPWRKCRLVHCSICFSSILEWIVAKRFESGNLPKVAAEEEAQDQLSRAIIQAMTPAEMLDMEEQE
jgi:hypothetical protein